VRSLKSRPGFVCRWIAGMEANIGFVGFISVLAFAWVIVTFVRTRHHRQLRFAQ
jgi:hypothetical protein